MYDLLFSAPMKIHYNAPVVLTYTIICVIIMTADMLTGGVLQANLALYPGFDFLSPVRYIQLFSYAAVHANWTHLIGNFTFILLIGPILEEKYGSKNMLIMIAITILVTAVFNSLLFSSALIGASGVVFMLILLASFANFKAGQIPLTFILIVFLFLGREIYAAFSDDHISQFAHILGGISGSIFGFLIKEQS